MPRKPIVALVGRPNVGKSTLFNRLAGERLAIVGDVPGTTRDRHYADVEWGGKVFTVVDTGGLVLDDSDEMLSRIREQAQIAMDEADVIVLLTDVVDGLMPGDEEIAALLRRGDKPVIVAANKADNLTREMVAHEFHALGLGEPLTVSAIRGLSTGDLLDRIVASLPELPEEADEPEVLHIAIVGRPNVGKSSLVNRLIGQERLIVSEVPGTTRDAVDTRLRYHDQDIVLIDTAGIRRRGRVEQGIEKYSVMRALKAISRADVVMLVIDASAGVTDQDAHVAGYILEQFKSAILVVNKWDLLEKDSGTMAQYEATLRRELRFMSYVPVAYVSALTGQRVGTLLPLALRIQEQRNVRVSTAELNEIIRQATARHSPPTKWGTKLRIYYGTQVSHTPPTFVLFVNDARLVHFSYQRYLENQIRYRFKFEGTPIRLIFRDHTEQR